MSVDSISKYHPETLPLPPSYVYGEPATEYTSEETAMGHYQSASIIFEQMRVISLATATTTGAPLDGLNPQNVPAIPPHILVIGPENSGKTTLCKTLVNYAVRGEPWGRDEWSPILVNVDPGDVRDLDAVTIGLSLTDPPSHRAHGPFQGVSPPSLCPPLCPHQRPHVHWDYRLRRRRRFGLPML